MNIRDRIKAIDDEYSESEIYLEYGLPSLMLYEPTPYKNLIVDINIERDKYTATEDRMKFISLYKQVYLAQRKKLKAILAGIEARTIAIFPEPMKEEMIGFWGDTRRYDDSISNVENLYSYAAACIRRALNDTDEEIYLLRHYPSVYYNYPNSYIGGEFSYRYENEVLIYNKVNILTDGMHHFKL